MTKISYETTFNLFWRFIFLIVIFSRFSCLLGISKPINSIVLCLQESYQRQKLPNRVWLDRSMYVCNRLQGGRHLYHRTSSSAHPSEPHYSIVRHIRCSYLQISASRVQHLVVSGEHRLIDCPSGFRRPSKALYVCFVDWWCLCSGHASPCVGQFNRWCDAFFHLEDFDGDSGVQFWPP